MRVRVDLGSRAVVACSVARTAEEQARGLQGHPGLAVGEGMLFPFHPPRAATFHMGTVAFPIDVVFADGAGRVARIVHGAEPGSRAKWSHPVVGAVVELPGGAAANMGLALGDRVLVAGRRLGQQTYNLLRTLTEAELDEPRGEDEDGFEVHAPGPFSDGYYSKEPLQTVPGGDHSHTNYPDLFQDRNPFADPNAMDGTNSHFEWNMGYSRPGDSEGDVGPVRMGAHGGSGDDGFGFDDLGFDIVAPEESAPPKGGEPLQVGEKFRIGGRGPVWEVVRADGASGYVKREGQVRKWFGYLFDRSSGVVEVYPIMQGSGDRAGPSIGTGTLERVTRSAQRYEVDLPTFLPAMAEAAARAGLPYQDLPLNENRARAIVTPKVVGGWLHALGLNESDRDALFDVATSDTGLDAIGSALIAAELAETANITQYGAQPVLVLTKNKGNTWT